jgi:hypothetical protein
MKFDANKPWVLFQDTKNGARYYTGKAHPVSPDAWTPAIDKALRLDWQSVANIQEWVTANTWGESIRRETVKGRGL